MGWSFDPSAVVVLGVDVVLCRRVHFGDIQPPKKHAGSKPSLFLTYPCWLAASIHLNNIYSSVGSHHPSLFQAIPGQPYPTTELPRYEASALRVVPQRHDALDSTAAAKVQD